MESLLNFALEKDVISAVEIVYEEENAELLNSSIYGVNAALFYINFGCIKVTDKVAVIGPYMDMSSVLISYIYTPQSLVTIAADPRDCISGKEWSSIRALLPYCKYTEPTLSSSYSVDEKEIFDVAFMGVTSVINGVVEATLSRFNLETGLEYEFFEWQLNKCGTMLRREGRLVVLCRAGWILKSWELIDRLGLQLEYDSYCLYAESIRHPNSLSWIRFIKREEDVNRELHKKNILSFMKDNNIDRLYAHRNDLSFPYVEMSYKNSDAYVKLDQNLEYMQYFFSVETTVKLSGLCEGFTACLATPSVAQYAYKINKNIVLFERDNRFRENGGLKFVKYDLNTGLTKLLRNRYANKFDRVICDPPFDIKLEVLAKDILELIKLSDKSIVYIIFPSCRMASLVNAMKIQSLILSEEREEMIIEYAKPPKIVRVNGRNAIQLYKFTYMDQ